MFSGSYLTGFDEICFENSSSSSLVGKGLVAGSLGSKHSSRSWEKKAKATETSLQFNGAGSRQLFSEFIYKYIKCVCAQLCALQFSLAPTGCLLPEAPCR